MRHITGQIRHYCHPAFSPAPHCSQHLSSLTNGLDIPVVNQSGFSGLIQALLTGLGGHYTNHNLCHRTCGRQIRPLSPGTERTMSLHVLCTLHFRTALQICGRVLFWFDIFIILLCNICEQYLH